MSTLLEQASLVMIPSGYKEDVVYSQIPTSGAGDLSFTRASNGTRINSAGLVEVCPWNLVQYSEDITNAVWGEFGATRSANTATAPNGTTTADTILPSATTSTHGIFQQITVANGIYSASAYFKANGYNYACIRIATNSDTTRYGVVISLIDGSVTATDTSGSPTNTSYSIETAGNGWFKLNVSCSHSSGFIYHTVGVSNVAVPTFANSLPSFTANGTSSIFIWGAQLNIGSTAKPYFPTTDRLNVPRLTYQNGGGGCPSLLLEKQSTNLNTYSNDFTNGWTQSGGTITATANYGISPDGTQNSTRLQFSAGNSIWRKSITGLVGNVGTWSLYIKGTAGETIAITYGGVDLLVTLASGWNRYSVTATATLNEVFVTTFLSATARNLEVWGGQCELSSYATSLIYTTTSSATRVADACFKTGISSLIGQSQGTIFVDSVLTHSATTNEYLIQVSESASNRFFIYREAGTNKLGCFARVGSTTIYTQLTSGAITGRVKAVFAYQSGSFAFYVNGTQIGVSTATFSTPPTMDRLDIDSNAGAENGYYNYNEAVLFPTRLSNSDLQALTA